MKRLAALPALLLTLPGAMCSTTQPGIEVRTVTVEKPVEKPCPGTVPTRPAKLDPLPDNPVSALALALAKLAEWSAAGKYGDQAEAYFKVCPPAN